MTWSVLPNAADRATRRPTTLDLLGLAAGLAGTGASITLLFLGMRAVMGVGGSCAEGGPYVIATPCPGGVGIAMPFGIFALPGSWGLAARFGPRVGGIWASAPILGWAGLFVSLGTNFLQAGLGEQEGVDPMGLLLGIMFWLMGLVPLILALVGTLGGSSSGEFSGQPIAATRARVAEATRARIAARDREAATLATGPSLRTGDDAGERPSRHATAPDLVAQLEHLADLRSRGLLDEAEYATAKAALLRAMEDAS